MEQLYQSQPAMVTAPSGRRLISKKEDCLDFVPVELQHVQKLRSRKYLNTQNADAFVCISYHARPCILLTGRSSVFCFALQHLQTCCRIYKKMLNEK